MPEPGRAHHVTVLVKLPEDREAFTITVSVDTTILSVTCSCPEGNAGHSCEHKLGVLLHDPSIIADQSHLSVLDTIQTLVHQTPFPVVWDTYQVSRGQLRTLERQLNRYMTRGLPRIL